LLEPAHDRFVALPKTCKHIGCPQISRPGSGSGGGVCFHQELDSKQLDRWLAQKCGNVLVLPAHIAATPRSLRASSTWAGPQVVRHWILVMCVCASQLRSMP